MAAHSLRITAVTAFILLCTLLPFLPGQYDSLAVPLSGMFQLFGKVALLVVPFGALWLAAEHWSRSAGTRYAFAIAAFIATSLVLLVLSLGALAFAGTTLAVGVLFLCGYAIWRMAPRVRHLTRAAAIYLIVVPIAVALLQDAVADPATEFSRSRAIRNSAPLIADIERYRSVHGRYPASLVSLNQDYRPSIIGIKEYRYEPSGEAYNLLFEQHSFVLGTREIVMYNPRDQQVMTSHDMDLLRRTSRELERRRGYYAVHDSVHPHWKYFLFD